MPMATLLRPGDVLGGFKVDEVIGIGGMAIVYRAQQISLGRSVALKVLSGEVSSDSHFRERFRREGAHAASLDHPNIVPVYDSGEEHGHLYLAMRLVEGTNLAELIHQRGLTADNAVEILRPVASALDTAHAAGLIHRDVKPQNILIASNGHPYLADFGIAKGTNTLSLTATGNFVGSVHFASPEQINGLTLTSASDIYALTAVLFQCLTGRVPYPRDSDAGVMRAHLHDPPPTLPGTAESDFHSVLARGMAKDPGARYGHAGDLINAAALCVRRLPNDRRNSIPAFPFATADDPGGSTLLPQMLEPESPHALADQTIVAERPVDRTVVHPHGVGASGSASGRMTEPPTAVPTRPPANPRRPARRIAAAVGLLPAAAIVAVVIALSSGSHAAGATILRTGNLALSIPTGWRSAPAAVNGLALRSPVAAESARTQVVAGTLANPDPVAGTLPAATTETSGRPTYGRVVSLALGRARLYSWSAAGHESVAVYLIATDRGEYAAACTARHPPTTPGPAQACAELLDKSHLQGAAVEYPGPDPAVTGTVGNLAEAREKTLAGVTTQLASNSLGRRGAALRRVAAADDTMAKELAGIKGSGRYRPVLLGVAAALEAEANMARRAGAAALAGDRTRYESARSAGPDASRQLVAATSALATLGLRQTITALDLSPAPLVKAQSTGTHPSSTPAQASESVTPSTTPSTSSPSSSASHPKPSGEVEVPQPEEK